MDFICKGIPTSCGSDNDGCQEAPYILDKIYSTDIINHKVGSLKNTDSQINEINDIFEESRKHYDNNSKYLTFGGDHTTTLFATEHLKNKKDTGILWLDAHADYNTIETSPSGNLHGMITSILSGEISSINYTGEFPTENIKLIGTQELDDGESKRIKNSNIFHLGDEDILNYEMAIERLCDMWKNKHDNFYVSLDLDWISYHDVPGVSVKEICGPRLSTAINVINTIISELNVVGLDIVEYNPTIEKEKTLNAVQMIMNEIN